MATEAQFNEINQTLFEMLSNPGLTKQAEDTVTDFTRTMMREDGFYRKIQPPVQIQNDQLDRQLETDKLVKIIDKEPGNPPAISLPFGTLPSSVYIYGPRWAVQFDRIVTPRFVKDVDELRTWTMDIRQVMSDNAIKDMLAEEDGKFIATFNNAIGGAAGTTLPWNTGSGTAQWERINGGITRDSWMDSLKIMPRGDSRLEVQTCLVNNIFIKDLQKWGRDEFGGDVSQDILRDGWSMDTFGKVKLIVTIKHGLVPENSAFHFADPKFVGKFFVLEDTTMYIKREAYLLQFFAYQTAGGGIGHSGGLARADFA